MSRNKHFFRSIFGKFAAVFLLSSIAILLSVVISHFTFKEILYTVDEISAPNRKFKVLTNLFQEATTLDKEQRAAILINPYQPNADLIKLSQRLLPYIDSLRVMPWDDPTQLQRLDSMEKILTMRDLMLVDYLRMRSQLIKGTGFSKKLDGLTDIIEEATQKRDSSIITSQQRQVVTTLLADTIRYSQERSFFDRLLGKNREATSGYVVVPRAEMHDILDTRIDTLVIARKDSALREVKVIFEALKRERISQSRSMMDKELDLINNSNLLTAQLLQVLHHVEEKEVAQLRSHNEKAALLVGETVSKINWILLLFFGCAVFLAGLIIWDIIKENFWRKKLLLAKEEAENLSLVKERFLANMSHEIRTPLQSIMGYSEQGMAGRLPVKEALDTIFIASNHLHQIVNQILDYSKISSGKIQLEEKVFLLESELKEVISAMEIQAKAKGLNLILDLPEFNHLALIGDPFRLKQVIFNLVGNAIKFTETGFVRLSVKKSINTEENTTRCIFKILDTGIGIGEDEYDNIFNEFEQGKSNQNGKYGGTGLGLSISKSIIEAMSGKIQSCQCQVLAPCLPSIYDSQLEIQKICH